MVTDRSMALRCLRIVAKRGLRKHEMRDKELQDILLTHNLTPRKCFGFKSPDQTLVKELGIDVKLTFRSISALRV